MDLGLRLELEMKFIHLRALYDLQGSFNVPLMWLVENGEEIPHDNLPLERRSLSRKLRDLNTLLQQTELGKPALLKLYRWQEAWGDLTGGRVALQDGNVAEQETAPRPQYRRRLRCASTG